MAHSRRSSRYGYDSRSPSPYHRRGRSVSRSLSRSRSRSRSWSSSDAENPGNNLYVTGLSRRMTKDELERHFAKEGNVIDVHLVLDPWTRESRGFGFVTMATVDDADRCLTYLDGSVLEGRVITVEKARRRRGRTPTPGQYLGLKTVHERHRSPSYSPYRRGYGSPRYSYESEPPYSPRYGRWRSRTRSRSPYYRYSRSPISRRGRRSYSRDSRSNSPSYYRYRSPIGSRRYRSVSRSISPRVGRSSRRSYSRSVSPRPRRSWGRSYSRSVSPRRRSHSRSPSPRPRRSLRSSRRSYSPDMGKSMRVSPYVDPSRRSKAYSRESYAHSRSMSPYSSRSVSRSPW